MYLCLSVTLFIYDCTTVDCVILPTPFLANKAWWPLGWVDIGIGTKGKRRFVVSLAKVWEIAKKF
jgi:hypothetical protein